MIKNIDRNVVVEYYVLFIRCEVRDDLRLKLMMRIDRVQNYKGNNVVCCPLRVTRWRKQTLFKRYTSNSHKEDTGEADIMISNRRLNR